MIIWMVHGWSMDDIWMIYGWYMDEHLCFNDYPKSSMDPWFAFQHFPAQRGPNPTNKYHKKVWFQRLQFRFDRQKYGNLICNSVGWTGFSITTAYLQKRNDEKCGKSSGPEKESRHDEPNYRQNIRGVIWSCLWSVPGHFLTFHHFLVVSSHSQHQNQFFRCKFSYFPRFIA